jgi:hypothetical protein
MHDAEAIRILTSRAINRLARWNLSSARWKSTHSMKRSIDIQPARSVNQIQPPSFVTEITNNEPVVAARGRGVAGQRARAKIASS